MHSLPQISLDLREILKSNVVNTRISRIHKPQPSPSFRFLTLALPIVLEVQPHIYRKKKTSGNLGFYMFLLGIQPGMPSKKHPKKHPPPSATQWSRAAALTTGTASIQSFRKSSGGVPPGTGACRIFDDFSGFFGLGFQLAMVLVCFKVFFFGFCQGQCHASDIYVWYYILVVCYRAILVSLGVQKQSEI